MDELGCVIDSASMCATAAEEGVISAQEGVIDCKEGVIDCKEGDIDGNEGVIDAEEGDIDGNEGVIDSVEGEVTTEEQKGEEKEEVKIMLTACVEEALSDVLIVSVQYGDKMFKGALMDYSKMELPYGVARASPSRFETEPRERHSTAVLGPNGKFQQPTHENSLTALSFRHSYHQTLPCSLVRPIKQKVTRSSLRSGISSSSRQKSVCPYCKSAFEDVPRQNLNSKEISCQTAISFAHIQRMPSLPPVQCPPVKRKVTAPHPAAAGGKKQLRSEQPTTSKSPMIKISYATPHGKDKVLCIKPKPQHVKIERKKDEIQGEFTELTGLDETRGDITVNYNTTAINNGFNKPIVVVKYSNMIDNNSDNTSSDTNQVAESTSMSRQNPPRTNATVAPPSTTTGFIHTRTIKPQLIKKQYTEYQLGLGRIMKLGDVVWGKIHGFPWWPCWVRDIIITYDGEEMGAIIKQEAFVIWFASPTTSYLSLTQLYPFTQHFKTKYDKRKRGSYKTAIKQAHEMLHKQETDPNAIENILSRFPGSTTV